ncbi:hypothetical protein [Novosphingobium sp. CECT 9465]|uniref:hypothetical protein n=1 Tax=Novosphingobium sp. CECT 9465 TaxID=2829794 RepID=UPI001E3F6854|nr:hypothetical protein [Novosphingobium sp. CECT 9465]
MLEALSEAGDLAIETVSGVKLYSVTRGDLRSPTALADEPSQFFQRGDRGL